MFSATDFYLQLLQERYDQLQYQDQQRLEEEESREEVPFREEKCFCGRMTKMQCWKHCGK